MIKKIVTKKLFLFLLYPILLCLALVGVYDIWKSFTKSNSDITLHPNTSKDLEFALASKCQLLTAGEETLIAYSDIIKTIRDAFKKANPTGKVLSKDELNEIVSDEVHNMIKMGSENAQESLKVNLRGLKNNLYVGYLASQMLDSVEKGKAIWDELGQVYTEMMSDIKIAKSLGVNTIQYESKLQTFTMYWLEFEILRGSPGNNDTGEKSAFLNN
jgi:hypothetical protein